MWRVVSLWALACPRFWPLEADRMVGCTTASHLLIYLLPRFLGLGSVNLSGVDLESAHVQLRDAFT